MFFSLTPHASSFALAPETRGAIMESFQRAWTMAIRRPEPSCCCGVGPLRDMTSDRMRCFLLKNRSGNQPFRLGVGVSTRTRRAEHPGHWSHWQCGTGSERGFTGSAWILMLTRAMPPPFLISDPSRGLHVRLETACALTIRL